MLFEIMQHINNFFVAGGYEGEIKIQDGDITPNPELLSEQYFLIQGSVLNDGVYQHPAEELEDEAFNGIVAKLAIPKPFLSLVDDIAAWAEKYKDVTESPYTSESFGGYSYTKSNGNGQETGVNGWQKVFSDRLNKWRKL